MTPTRTPTSVPTLHVGEWCLAGAVCTGGFWAIGILLGRVLLGVDITDSHEIEPAVWLFVVCLGALGGAVPAACMLRPAPLATVYWGCVMAFAIGFGVILSLLAIQFLHDPTPRHVSSSLGFAFGGAVAGFAGYVWARWNTNSIPPGVEEDAAEPLGEGKSDVAKQRRFAFALRSLPIILIVISSLAIGDRIARADPVLALLVVVLGTSSAIALGDHALRLRKLEAHRPPTESGE